MLSFSLGFGYESCLLCLQVLGQLCDRSLVVLIQLASLLLDEFRGAALLLRKCVGEGSQLRIESFDLLVLPLFLLCQNLKVELHIGRVVSLQTTNVNLVLKLHEAALVGLLKFENLGDNGVDDRVDAVRGRTSGVVIGVLSRCCRIRSG